VRELDDERLDATFYSPPAVQLCRSLSDAEATPFGDHADMIKVNEFDVDQPISYFEIGGVDISTGCAWPTVVASGEAPSRAQRSVAHWDILVGTVRPERKNVGIVPPSSRGQLVATSGVAVLRAKSPVHAAFLWSYLRSDAATEQLMRWNTGAAYPAIDDEVALRVLVPHSRDDDVVRLGARWMRIPALYAWATELVAAARLLVEALIERKVTEAELIAAGQDVAADRALLARLAEDGLDGTGKPLFSDLDGLDALLAEARCAEGTP
jgi:type I restriction enzyme S subunit